MQAIILAHLLFRRHLVTGAKTELVCNDVAQSRYERLRKVIQEHVPSGVRANIRITQRDGSRYHLNQRERGHYDRVLVDAPCSSERHVIQQIVCPLRACGSSSDVCCVLC